MSVRNWLEKTIRNPRGAWSAVDQVLAGNPTRAFLAQNIRIAPGRVSSREGTSVRAAVAGKVTGIYNWISSAANLALFAEGGAKLRSLNLAGGGITDLVTGLAFRGISAAEAGPRAIVSFFSTAGLGAAQARVTDGVSIADKAFEPPLASIAITATDGGSGYCTAGTHLIAFVFQSRTGYSGQFSPQPAGIFTPASVTLNAGNRAINLQITLNTPATAGIGSAIYAVMTRADNPNRFYFVPGCFAILPAGAAGWTQVFPQISITDEDLADSAEDASAQQLRLSQNISGNGPISPSVVVPYRHRTVYVANNKAYVSEINDAQAITEDQNVIQTPGQQRIIAAFEQGQNLYLVGDKWTAATNDNGDLPATWSQPEMVAAIGTMAPNGIEWRTAGGYAWIASEHGLWVFQGTYDPYHPGQPKPITYLSADWKRINWAAAYAVQVVDDIVNLKCYVAAPLDGATEPTHLFVIDYTNGLTYDTCDISLDNFDAATFSAIAVVKDAATSRSSAWIGPAAAGNITGFDTSTHNDNGHAIHSVWESAFLREDEDQIESNLMRVGNAHIRARGNGSLIHTWYGMDRSAIAVTNIVVASGVATVNAPAHGLIAGQPCTILESATAALNGIRIVQGAALNGFTLSVPGVPDGVYTDASVTAGLAVQPAPLTLAAGPAVDLFAKFDLHPVETYSVRLETNAVDAWLEVSKIRPYFKKSLFVR